jgi:hypothetical protein
VHIPLGVEHNSDSQEGSIVYFNPVHRPAHIIYLNRQIESQSLRSCLCRHVRTLDYPTQAHTASSDISFGQSNEERKGERNRVKPCNQLAGGFTAVNGVCLPIARGGRRCLICLCREHYSGACRAGHARRARLDVQGSGIEALNTSNFGDRTVVHLTRRAFPASPASLVASFYTS